MKGGTVVRGEPVAWIEGQELNLRSLRQLRGLFHHESTIMNSGFDRHAERIPRVLLSRLYVPGAEEAPRAARNRQKALVWSVKWHRPERRGLRRDDPAAHSPMSIFICSAVEVGSCVFHRGPAV